MTHFVQVGPLGPCVTTDPLIAIITTAGVVLTTGLTAFLAYRRQRADYTAKHRALLNNVQNARMLELLTEMKELYEALCSEPANKKGHADKS